MPKAETVARTMFYLIALGIWLSIHVYTGTRIISPLGLAPAAKAFAWSAVIISFALIPLTFSLRLGLPKPIWYTPLFWLTFIMMGYVTTLFPLMLAKDAMFWSWTKLGAYKTVNSQNGGLLLDTGGAGHMKLSHKLNLTVMVIAAALVAAGVRQASSAPVVKEVDVQIKNLAPGLEGLKIALITDIHISHSIRKEYVEDVVRQVNKLEPDIVAHTGDLVDATVEEMRSDAMPLAQLNARNGVFFVTGNHEYYWNLFKWLEVIQETGAVILNNEHRLIEHNGAKILVAGVTDYTAHQNYPPHRSDPEKALSGAPDRDLTIMLAHQPRSAVAVAKTGQVDLQLTGHSHGGQYFPWTFVVRLFHPVHPGLSWYNGMWVYVSRGTGTWGPPMRLGAQHEITLLTLRGGADPGGG